MFEKDKSSKLSAIGVTPTVWVVCVSASDQRLRAEVSCPEIFEGNQFEGFSKRIFVVDESIEPIIDQDESYDEDSGDAEIEVHIAKK